MAGSSGRAAVGVHALYVCNERSAHSPSPFPAHVSFQAATSLPPGLSMRCACCRVVRVSNRCSPCMQVTCEREGLPL